MKNIILCVALLLGTQSLTAETYENAINLLKANKRKEAITALRELQNSPADKANASLALSIIEINDGRNQESFNDFQIFFQNSPNPYPYVYALYSSGIFGRTTPDGKDELSDFFQKILADPKANCTIKSYAVHFLGFSLQRQDDFDAAKKMFANICDVKNWSTVGVFENISGSGFNKDFGVLDHPEADHKFTNKSNATVQWFNIPEVRNDRWSDLTYSYIISDAIDYTQTFINSDEDKEVILMIGVSGSLKVWLNDYLVASEEEERNTNEDVYNYRVKLQKGANRLLLQIGSSEVKKNNYLVRIADLNGNLLTNLISTSTYQAYAKAKPYEVKQIPLFAETYFEQLVAKQPDDFINQLLLLSVYNHNEKKYQAQKVLAKLRELAPLSSIVSYKIIEAARIDNNITDETKAKEFIKTNDPDSYMGVLLRYNDAISKENWDEAISMIDMCEALYGESPTTKIDMIYALSKKKDDQKFGAGVNAAYQKYPDNQKIVEYKYFATFSQTKDFDKSRYILDKYLKNNSDEEISKIIIESDLKTGDKKEAINIIKTGIENYPASNSKYSDLMKIYYDTHQFDDALECCEKILKCSPYYGGTYYWEGLIYAAKGNKSTAIDLTKKAVYYSPTNYDAREKLRDLQGKKKLNDFFMQNDVVKLYHDALANEKYTKEEAVVLMNDKRQIVYPENGAVEEQVEILVYINSQAAVQQFKEYNIIHNAYSQKLIIEKAELLKKDGNKVPAERQKGDVVFSSLGIGDAVHLYYKLEDSYGGKLSEHFWNEMYFNSVYPTQTSRYSLIIPVDKKFDYRFSQKYFPPQVTTIDDYKMCVWEKNDIPKIEAEPLMTSTSLDKIVISSIPDWSYVANWYSDVSNMKTKADFEVKEKVKELMAGNENRSDSEKAGIIYNYIENNYNYSSVPFLHSAFTPQRASRTMSTKLGDCKDLSTLFVSMAKEAGLNANLVLVRTKGSGDDDLLLPSITFNHCIAELHTANKNYIVELTNNYLPFAAMGIGVLNANGLFVPRDGGSVTDAQLVKLNTPDRPLNANVRETKITFSDDQAIIHRVVYKIGSESANSRYYYKDLDENERVKKLAAAVSGELSKQVKIENLKINNLNNLSDTIILNYDAKVDNFSNDIVGMKVFRLPWTDAHFNEQLFSLDKRKYSMDLSGFTNNSFLSETISVDLPTGKKLAEKPTDVSIITPEISYSIKYEVKEDKLIAVRKIIYLKDIISSLDYESVKEVIAKINQADTKEMAFK